jgi:hypothetical protein
MMEAENEDHEFAANGKLSNSLLSHAWVHLKSVCRVGTHADASSLVEKPPR